MTIPPSLEVIWDEFIAELEGPNGCNFTKDILDRFRWTCTSKVDRPIAHRLLSQQFGLTSSHVEECMDFFDRHGGFCDCEIIFNVVPHVAAGGQTL